MEPFEDVATETLLAGRSDWMDDEALAMVSAYPLECIETEYPHHARAVESPDDPDRPSEEHPLFYGCFDWHSAVHSHWCLVRQRRLFDDHPDEDDIVETLSARFTEDDVAGELAVFEDDESFEKPYGWGWLLRLAAELRLWDSETATEWRRVLEPLEQRVAELVESEFLTQERPFRVGTHHNSAFALQCVLDYARVVGDEGLETAAMETAREFYAADTDYPLAYEPLSWDFLSPGLTEADLMRRVLDGDEFAFGQVDVRAVAELDGEGTGDDQKQFVGVVVVVPDELAVDFGEFDCLFAGRCTPRSRCGGLVRVLHSSALAIEFGGDPWRPLLVERIEGVVERDFLHERALPPELLNDGAGDTKQRCGGPGGRFIGRLGEGQGCRDAVRCGSGVRIVVLRALYRARAAFFAMFFRRAVRPRRSRSKGASRLS